jgi:hypothetical protein
MTGSRRKFTDEFKREAVELMAKEGLSFVEAGVCMGISTHENNLNQRSGPRRKSLTKGTTFALFVAQKVSPKVSPTPETTQGRECGLVLTCFATLSCVESG